MKYIILKGKFKQEVEKHFPNLDTSKPIDRMEYKSLRKTIEMIYKKRSVGKKFEYIKKNGIEPGARVEVSREHQDGFVATVLSIYKDGTIRLKEAKGSFSPYGLKILKSNEEG